MLKWKIAILFVAGALATVGLKGIGGDGLRAEVPPVGLNSGSDDFSARRDDLAEELSVVSEPDDGDDTEGNDGTSGGANTGDGDLTNGNDGTSGGANTGDGDLTNGNDGTSGGANTRGGANTGGGAGTGGGSDSAGGTTG
jgi:hypothetical protein